MKKIIAAVFILSLLLSCSGCDIITNSKLYQKNAYEKANVAYEQGIALSKDKEYRSAVDYFKLAAERYKKAGDYQDAVEKAQIAMDCYDKATLIIFNNGYGTTYTLNDAKEIFSTLYNLETAEKYNQFYQIGIKIVGLINSAESYISSRLKNPSSYKAIDCHITWDVSHVNDNIYLIRNISLDVDYTATNSFGGTVRNQQTLTAGDDEYIAEFKYTELDTETLLSLFSYRDWEPFFEDLINSYDVAI